MIGIMMEICRYTSLIYADYCYFFSSGMMCMYILRPFMDEVLSEEIVKKDNEIGGNIPGGDFLGGNFPRGGGFSRGEFVGWDFCQGGFS